MDFSVSDLVNFYRCPRLLFLNTYGDKSQQQAPSDFLKKLWRVGRNYETKVVDFFEYEKPKYKVGDHAKGFEETLKLMKAGVETIYQGVLKNDELIGIPDFLIKAKGISLFGEHYYYPVDVKGASTSRERYLFQLACYSYLLGDIQGFTPLYGGLLLLDMDLQIKYLFTLMKQVIFAIDQSKKIVSNPDIVPELFIDSNCQMCQWQSYCLPEANKTEDLSLVPGINKKIKEMLEEINIKNYTELGNCSIDDISQIEDLNSEKGKNIILQAKALKENKIFLKTQPKLSKDNKCIYMDFESDMIFDEKGTEMIRVDYLIGFLISEDRKKEEYSYLLLEDEEKLLNDFIFFLNKYLNYNFYHYGHYEQTIFDKKWTSLPKVSLINIEKIVKDSVIMPVTSYSLKNIAKALGFKWRNKQANAMQSMCWYSNYLETKDRNYLNLSIEYNHDDCLALYFVTNWLLKLNETGVPLGEFIDLKELNFTGL